MNVTMTLTMQGLIRSLNSFAHDLADELEHDHHDRPRRDETRPPRKVMSATEGQADERRR